MYPKLSRRFERVERQRESLVASVRALSAADQAYHPSPHAWSAADVIQHLVLVDELTTKQLVSPREGIRPRRRVTTRLLYGLTIAVLRSPIRIKAPSKLVVPTSHMPIDILEARWRVSRDRMAGYLESAAPDSLGRPVYRHPIAGWLTLPETLGFLEAHTANHSTQLARIARLRRHAASAAPA
ncbi:MAG: DinB family protein [Gemmatimonadaceae bacterium]